MNIYLSICHQYTEHKAKWEALQKDDFVNRTRQYLHLSETTTTNYNYLTQK